MVGAITSGKLPQKSESDESMWNDGLENLWKVSSRCWARNPAHRPTAAKIVRLLVSVLLRYQSKWGTNTYCPKRARS